MAGSFRPDTVAGRVSWPLSSFLVIAVVLAAGWIAYERSRPSARMTAVVAVMAAIAALGRDAFAALPDVKPITAITLVVGYSLGPLPGFTVGAIGMLVSNFMFGQGSYTPWQMAAWGIVGLAGGALGKLSSRRLGRLPLALACATTALCAKEMMNLYTWTLGATHTPAAFVLVAGAGLPFDVTDTIASFLFGLAFAPELAGMLDRTRMRMEVTWGPVPTDADASPPEPAPSGVVQPAAVASAITGTDLGGVAVAAGDFNAATPRNRFAVALTPGHDVPLPEEIP
jgi:energy-coupling factor transport system substrate-specific component